MGRKGRRFGGNPIAQTAGAYSDILALPRPEVKQFLHICARLTRRAAICYDGANDNPLGGSAARCSDDFKISGRAH